MTTWQQAYPGQGAPPPAGFQIPNAGYPPYPQPGYPQAGYPPQPGYPQQGFPGAGPQFAPQFVTPHPDMFGGDQEAGYDNFSSGNFDDQTVRRGFIKKVYSILMCQILVTISIMAIFLFHEPTKLWVQQHLWMYYVVFVALFIIMIVLACCGEVRRKFPINIILLGVFTCLQGVSLGVICSVHKVPEVMLAMGITAVICLALTLFAFQTKWDFTVMGAGLVICCVCLMIFGIVAMFVQMKIVNLIYCCIGAVLFSMYLVYDTQMMMGGKHKYSISPEEYIFAALSLYIDIINIFIMILGIISNSRD